MELYVNGEFYSFMKHSGNIGTTDKDITYGRKDRTDTEYTFAGILDEIRIYNDELSLSEIRELPETWELLPSSVENTISDLQIQILKGRGVLRIDTGGRILKNLEVFNIQGMSFPCKWQKECEYFYSISTENLSSGIYVLRLTDKSGKNYRYKIIL